jgi:hypothetical protein
VAISGASRAKSPASWCECQFYDPQGPPIHAASIRGFNSVIYAAISGHGQVMGPSGVVICGGIGGALSPRW